jgi:hypothetical protein
MRLLRFRKNYKRPVGCPSRAQGNIPLSIGPRCKLLTASVHEKLPRWHYAHSGNLHCHSPIRRIRRRVAVVHLLLTQTCEGFFVSSSLPAVHES